MYGKMHNVIYLFIKIFTQLNFNYRRQTFCFDACIWRFLVKWEKKFWKKPVMYFCITCTCITCCVKLLKCIVSSLEVTVSAPRFAAPLASRCYSHAKVETDEEFDARWVTYFSKADLDAWELRKGDSLCFAYSNDMSLHCCFQLINVMVSVLVKL